MSYWNRGTPTNTEIQEAVVLWRLGMPTTKINTERALRLRERYHSSISVLHSSPDPNHEVMVKELTASKDYLQEIIERRLLRGQ